CPRELPDLRRFVGESLSDGFRIPTAPHPSQGDERGSADLWIWVLQQACNPLGAGLELHLGDGHQRGVADACIRVTQRGNQLRAGLLRLQPAQGSHYEISHHRIRVPDYADKLGDDGLTTLDERPNRLPTLALVGALQQREQICARSGLRRSHFLWTELVAHRNVDERLTLL